MGGTENVQPGDPVSQGKRSVHSNSQREAPFAMDADMAFNPPDKPPAYGQQRVKVGADNITNKKFDPDVYSANCAAAKDVSMQGRERNRIGGGNTLSFDHTNYVRPTALTAACYQRATFYRWPLDSRDKRLTLLCAISSCKLI